MADSLKLALAQIDPTVGDIQGNAELIRRARAEAARQGADLVVLPELVLLGYPPDDLVLKPAVQEAAMAAIEALALDTADGGPGLIVGSPLRQDGRLYNGAALLDGGRLTAMRFKHELPNYGPFDDKRIFSPGPLPGPVNFRGTRLGLMICEDMWLPDVGECLEESGAELLVVINGSPYEQGKTDKRLSLAVSRVSEARLPLVYVNQLGGQDELVFDGASFALGLDCSLKAQLPAWESCVTTLDWRRNGEGRLDCAPGLIAPIAEGLEPIYRAMVLGLRDYVQKNRFPGVILGLSGGIDSALAAALAVDALGPERVWAVMMPSPYTSRDSLEDAAEVAKLLGIRLDEIGIGPAMQAFSDMLQPQFAGREPDITEENLQSRARGMTLMALSNKFGHMVLSTGNKSEMSVGYATLYGDMCGGYAVLKDVYKTTIFALCRWRNQTRPADVLGPDGRVMPERVITKPPSAELKPDQTDHDSLPPYDELDGILNGLIEDEQDVEAIVARGYPEETVVRVWRMLDRAEYKRRQAPPGVKITSRAFGRDRRYPITNRFLASQMKPSGG